MAVMRLMDSDILTYALHAKHVMHPYCWPILQKAVRGEVGLALSVQSLLESYNALVHDYKVEPEEASVKLDGLSRSKKILFLPATLATARRAFEISKKHAVRSYDAHVIACAELANISIVLSNDRHIEKLCRERGLVLENPIPKSARSGKIIKSQKTEFSS
jgi:predicted nucleic acid-binding protein